MLMAATGQGESVLPETTSVTQMPVQEKKSHEAVKEKSTGEMIATRIRKADGASFLTEMPILRHVERSDAALQEELIAAGFEAAGEYNVRNINDLGNVCVLLARKPLAPAAGAANV